MSQHYWTEIRQTIDVALKEAFCDDGTEPSELMKQYKLRPPKEPAWGDLCCNILMMLRERGNDEAEGFKTQLLGQLNALDWIKNASVAENGYLNLWLDDIRFHDELLNIIEDGVAYGLKGIANRTEALKIEMPSETADLLSLRQSLNADCLLKLAEYMGVDADKVPWAEPERKGFSTSGALAKCGETNLKLSLLSNASDFAVQFSPVLAVDRCYDNPAFCIPYAEARLKSLMSQKVEEVGDEAVELLALPDISGVLDDSSEKKLLAKLLEWPIVVRKTLREGDMVNLMAFLHRVSLLFFDLVEKKQVQSSSYLEDENTKYARHLLLSATGSLLSGGLDLLGVERLEEFI